MPTQAVSQRVSRKLSAQLLARLLLHVVKLGIMQRERGTCLGVGLLCEMFTGTRCWRLPRWVQAHLTVAHVRRGHDLGCYEFGVSLRELTRLAKYFDGSDAIPLLLEALNDAVAEVRDMRGSWNAGYVLETAEIHMFRRITPSQLMFAASQQGEPLGCTPKVAWRVTKAQWPGEAS